MEPHISPNALAALYSPDAGTVTPYEYAIALAENAADNGVEIKTRHEVVGIDKLEDGSGGGFVVRARDWSEEQAAGAGGGFGGGGALPLLLAAALGAAACGVPALLGSSAASLCLAVGLAVACGLVFSSTTGAGRAKGEFGSAARVRVRVRVGEFGSASPHASRVPPLTRVSPSPRAGEFGTARVLKGALHPTLAFQAGSEGRPVEFRARHVINSAGLFSDKVARMVGDESFKIKPRLGDYLLLHKNQASYGTATPSLPLSLSPSLPLSLS